jgi:hypothetical protein
MKPTTLKLLREFVYQHSTKYYIDGYACCEKHANGSLAQMSSKTVTVNAHTDLLKAIDEEIADAESFKE